MLLKDLVLYVNNVKNAQGCMREGGDDGARASTAVPVQQAQPGRDQLSGDKAAGQGPQPFCQLEHWFVFTFQKISLKYALQILQNKYRTVYSYNMVLQKRLEWYS